MTADHREICKAYLAMRSLSVCDSGNGEKNMTIGKRIKECRMKIGMTQEELAEVLYIPKTTVSSYERDVVDMKMGIIKELAKALHTTVGYLIEGDGEELDADVMRVAILLQEMPVELRRVAMEQVKVLAGLNMAK